MKDFYVQNFFQKNNSIHFYYVCAYRAENKCWKADQCSASVNVETNEGGEVSNVEMINKYHNHINEESKVVKWRIMDDMNKEYINEATILPSVVRKKVILKYQQIYRSKPDIWQEVQSLMPSDDSIDKRLR